jgi:hypothetical protein
VIEAVFINHSDFIAVTEDSVKLYTISKNDISPEEFDFYLLSSYSVSNYRIRYSAKGNSLLISGCGDDSRRALLFLADGDTGILEQININEQTVGGELMFAFYDDINQKIYMRIKYQDYNAVYSVDRYTHEAELLISHSESMVILAVDENYMYYSLKSSENNETSIYKYALFNNLSEELYVFENPVSFERSADLSNFAVNTENGKRASVFITGMRVSSAGDGLPETDILTPPISPVNALTFVKRSNNVLTDGEYYYIINSYGELEMLYDSAEAFINDRGDISELFSIYDITAERIKIRLKN